MKSVLFFAFGVFPVFLTAQENRTDDAESRLINNLMKNYDIKRQILPTNNRSKAVVVTFDMAFSLLVDLDSKDQIMTCNIWVRQFWTNNRLSWDPDEFEGITVINVSPKIVWKPDILLYNK
ncbi:hypothetical protein ABFA07_001565 [Porites harrisoni]